MISENYDKKISRVDILTTTGVSKSVLEGLEKLKIIKKSLIEQENFSKPKITFSKTLTKKQKNIANSLKEKVRSLNYSTTLLRGVTGSGKTEIYMEAISEAISINKQVLVLFPEISLSSNFYEIIKKRFERGFAEWHSGVSKKKKENFKKYFKRIFKTCFWS